MGKEPTFDAREAHKFFSAQCFNAAWDQIDNTERSGKQNEQMLLASFASLWHWTQRPECDQSNYSLGYWQLSRVYSLLGEAENARKYAELCLSASQGEGMLPFYTAYAYEALARAEATAGNGKAVEKYLAEANRVMEKMTDADARNQLLADLSTIVMKES